MSSDQSPQIDASLVSRYAALRKQVGGMSESLRGMRFNALLGGQPARPISAFRLAERLRQPGLRSGQARSAALFQPATQRHQVRPECPASDRHHLR